MALEYTPTKWADGQGGGTPLTAARLNNIENQVNALTALLAQPENMTTIKATAPANIEIYAKRVGNIVQMNVYVKGAVTIKAWSTVTVDATIPEGWRPISDFSLMGIGPEGTSVNLGDDGTVGLQNNNSAGTSVTIAANNVTTLYAGSYAIQP